MRPFFMNTKKITYLGALAALYAAITVLSAPWAYGPIQVRLAEALCFLCLFYPKSVWGLTLGCILANLFSTVSALDLVFGSAATLLGCLLAGKIRQRWLFPLPLILCNALLVGAELSLTLTPDSALQGLLLYGGQVALGESAALYLLGIPLAYGLERANIPELLKKLDEEKSPSA